MTDNKENNSAQLIKKTAKDLFMKYGIRRVTVEEICREAGISKMTFYRLYKNKDDVAEKIMQEVCDEGMKDYKAIMRGAAPFPERIRGLIRLKMEGTEGISEEFVDDILRSGTPGLMKILADQRQEMLKELLNDLKAAQEEGWIRKDIKQEFIIYFLGHMQEVILDKKFLSIYKDTQQAIMELTQMFFYGILTPKDQE